MKYVSYFKKFKFDPTANSLDSEFILLSTKITYKNCKKFQKYFWASLLKYLITSLFILGFSLLLGFTSENYEKVIVGIVVGAVFFTLILLLGILNSIFGWSFELEESDEKDWFLKNESAYIELEKHNKQEFIKRDEWRKNYPFEEKIRKALESKNGNDIAEVIKMIMKKENV